MFVSRRERKQVEWAFKPKPQSPTEESFVELEKRRKDIDSRIRAMEDSLPKVRKLRESLCRSN